MVKRLPANSKPQTVYILVTCLVSASHTMDLVVMLIGHSFVRRFARRATLQGQSTAEAVGLAGVCELHTFSTPTFASLLACPAALLVRIRTLRQLPDILVIDLGSNDLCPVDAAVSRVVAEAMDLLEWLHGHYLHILMQVCNYWPCELTNLLQM